MKIKETIQKQQAYEFMKTHIHPGKHPLGNIFIPVINQKIYLIQKEKERKKRNHALYILIIIILSTLLFFLEFCALLGTFFPS